MNDNQNYFVQAGRTTSRVLSQPGGRPSFMLGGWTEEELQKQREREMKKNEPSPSNPVEKENIEEEKSEQKAVQDDPVVKKPEPAASVAAPDTAAKKPVSSNAFASGANMNSCNVLTDRPTSRVRAPPGGHSSFRLGM